MGDARDAAGAQSWGLRTPRGRGVLGCFLVLVGLFLPLAGLVLTVVGGGLGVAGLLADRGRHGGGGWAVAAVVAAAVSLALSVGLGLLYGHEMEDFD